MSNKRRQSEQCKQQRAHCCAFFTSQTRQHQLTVCQPHMYSCTKVNEGSKLPLFFKRLQTRLMTCMPDRIDRVKVAEQKK
mmetsp:Transcript_37420/g.60298  ORF Transcript_37420/g.60298 Transcript_37420/m.60298 type:complete len:80 (-) Transcript_37420:35-274(-)